MKECPIELSGECRGNDCEWWNDHSRECCIKTLAKAISSIEYRQFRKEFNIP